MNSTELKLKIDELKKNTLNRHDHWVYEPNKFDIHLEKLVLFIGNLFKLLVKNKMIKVIYHEIIDSFRNLLNAVFDKKIENSKTKQIELNNLEKKLDNHLELYHTSIVENKELKKEISDLHSKIEKYFVKNRSEISSEIGHNSNSRVDFYQEENIRLGSELVETKKKFEILKSEIEKYEQQRSNLITKINSVNDALNDTNVLTNVFNNDVKSKVNVIDHKKIEKKSNTDLNDEVKKIFQVTS